MEQTGLNDTLDEIYRVTNSDNPLSDGKNQNVRTDQRLLQCIEASKMAVSVSPSNILHARTMALFNSSSRATTNTTTDVFYHLISSS